jgi:hypothetical protein
MATHHPFPDEAAERLAPLLPKIKTKAVYQRFQCVWLRATLHWSAVQIAQALGWQPQSVRQVQSDYARDGESVLWGKPHGGRRHAHFTVEQEKALLAPFLEHASVVYRALHRQGGRKVVPRPRPPKTSEATQEAFKKVTGDHSGANNGAGPLPQSRFATARHV